MVFPAICKSTASASWLNMQRVVGLVQGARCVRYSRDMNQGQDWFELVADSGNARIRWPGSGGQDQELGSGGQELGEIRIRRAGGRQEDQSGRQVASGKDQSGRQGSTK